MEEETEPKTVEGQEPGSIFTDVELESGGRNSASLDALLPANVTSAEKRELLSVPNDVFSGRHEPAKVRGILLTLEEKDLRDLREQLFTELCCAVPAVAGRQLSRRVTGNTSALAEDCWALGYSASQGVLTQRADSSTLKSAGRDPLPPPGPLRSSPSASSADSGAAASMEAIISMQLRLEREVAQLRRDKANDDVRLRCMEREATRLQEECTARDSRIAQLVALVEDLLARETALPPQRAAGDVPGAEATEPQDRSASTAAVPDVSSAREPCSEPSLAAEIAAGIDLRALGGAIASALQWSVGDSDDSETELAAPTTCPASGRRGPAGLSSRALAKPTSTQRAATDHDEGPMAETESTARSSGGVVTGAGAVSDLVASTAARPEFRRRKFVLEGFRPDASDRDVRGLVLSAVQHLHGFHSLPRHTADNSKAYFIEVSAADEASVLDPSSWPVGLTVRPKMINRRRRRRTFRSSQQAYTDRSPSDWQTDGPTSHRVSGEDQESTERMQSASHQVSGEDREWHRAAANTTAQRDQQESVRYSDVVTGYAQEHGPWQQATNRRRRGGQQVASGGYGRTQQAHWDERPGDRWTQRRGDQWTQRRGDQWTQRPGDQWTQRSGDQWTQHRQQSDYRRL